VLLTQWSYTSAPLYTFVTWIRSNLPLFSRDATAPVGPFFVYQVTTNILFVKETKLYFYSPKEATKNLFCKTVSTAHRYETWPGINTVSVGGLLHQ
jgi:hypothetical protein